MHAGTVVLMLCELQVSHYTYYGGINTIQPEVACTLNTNSNSNPSINFTS